MSDEYLKGITERLDATDEGRPISNRLLADFFQTKRTVLSATDQVTVAMLRSLIANIEAGNVTTLDRSGVQTGDDTAELTLILSGRPDIGLGR